MTDVQHELLDIGKTGRAAKQHRDLDRPFAPAVPLKRLMKFVEEVDVIPREWAEG